MIPRVARGFRLMNTGEYESFLSFSFLVHHYFFDVSTFCCAQSHELHEMFSSRDQEAIELISPSHAFDTPRL